MVLSPSTATTPRGIVLLGATGSIGQSTLRVLRRQPADFRLLGISAHRNRPLAEAIVREFSVPHLSLTCDGFTPSPEELVATEGVDLVVLALPGLAALRPLLAAIAANKTVALASKEVVVAAGAIIGKALRDHPTAHILPLDSEHCGIFQCLGAPQAGAFQPNSEVKKIWLTASGGPFLHLPKEEFSRISVTQALRHPTWSMGAKVSIDAATLANKGLEEIEAAHLFQLTPDQIGVVVQPTSQVHALVELRGGITLAALHPPSMEFPLASCLNHPNPPPVEQAGVDFNTPIHWDFFPPDRSRFPCLALAEAALRAGKSSPCDFDAANAEAVQAFLSEKISFDRIPDSIDRVMDILEPVDLPTVEAVEERHGMVRNLLQITEKWS